LIAIDIAIDTVEKNWRFCMTIVRYILLAAVCGLSACTWVEPTKEGSEVVLAKAFNVETCKKLGTTTSTVKHKVGFIVRDEETVTEELVTLAKNRAAELGGNSIVAQGPTKDGRMSFDVYKCGD
jgi:hypothetical protein